jgi:hypothetical protein
VKKALPVVAALLVWTVALAALSGFDDMDVDRDGAVSPLEHAEAAGKMFTAMDADGDDKVTAAEMDAAHNKVAGKPAGPDELSASLSQAEFDAGHAALKKE